jgi:hypothetical protein
MPQPLLLSIVGLLGIALGPILNATFYRVRREESPVRPGSHGLPALRLAAALFAAGAAKPPGRRP